MLSGCFNSLCATYRRTTAESRSVRKTGDYPRIPALPISRATKQDVRHERIRLYAFRLKLDLHERFGCFDRTKRPTQREWVLAKSRGIGRPFPVSKRGWPKCSQDSICFPPTQVRRDSCPGKLPPTVVGSPGCGRIEKRGSALRTQRQRRIAKGVAFGRA